MGMAASQARYIALTARMNDVEYEAQQINQQRLTLSNKMNEVTEAIYNMDVPTPPSKIDFAIENYSGKVQGRSISIRRDKSGAFKAYEVKVGAVVESTSGTKGEKKMNFSQVEVKGETKYRYNFPADFVEEVKQTEDGKYHYYDAKTDSWPEIENVEQYKEEYQVFSYEQLKNYYVVEGTSVRKVTPDDVNEDGSLNIDPNNLVREDENGTLSYNTIDATEGQRVTSHDGKKSGTVGTIPNIDESTQDEALKNAFSALKHSNPDYSDDELRDKFYLVSYDDGSYAFVLQSDFDQSDAAVTIFEIEQDGKFEEEIDDDIYKISYSTTGAVQGITYDGKYSILESTQKFDEVAYEEAMAGYKYEKTVYDSEQNELNKKTSIYQRQDKQLELKLTRLDTERNALNTELEAVKKVIQDATEKGFKTFSG